MSTEHRGSVELCAPGRCDAPECPCNREAIERGALADRAASDDDKVREDMADEQRDAEAFEREGY